MVIGNDIQSLDEENAPGIQLWARTVEHYIDDFHAKWTKTKDSSNSKLRLSRDIGLVHNMERHKNTVQC